MSDDDSINGEDDENIRRLSTKTLHRIDKAFDDSVKSLLTTDAPTKSPEKSPQRRRHPGAESEAGGFIVDDEPGGFLLETFPEEAGGFIVDDDDLRDDAERPQYIPLSLIPTALQLLDLQPDDPDVLGVFRNAASGWGAGDDQVQSVSRKDWRAVCAVLMGNDDDDDEAENNSSQIDLEQNTTRDATNESDNYGEDDQGSELDDEMDSGDEYIPGSRKATAHKKTSNRKRRRESSSPLSSDEETPKTLSSRQKHECRKAFALFFPDVSEFDTELDNKKIMIKDIASAASLLKEKLSVEDIIEMIELFSTSNDKSLTLADFERIMVAAKLA